MTQEAKVIFGIGIVTLVILFGGVIFLSKDNTSAVESTTAVDKTILLGNTKNVIKATNEKAVLVEFADFQCPACKAAHPYVKQILDKYKGRITFVYRHFPLQQHRNGVVAAKAAEAAGKQGKFWEMYDYLYIGQDAWAENDKPEEVFAKYSTEIGINVSQFETDLASNEFEEVISEDQRDGLRLGVNSTPTFFLNGKKLELTSLSDLPAIVDEYLEK